MDMGIRIESSNMKFRVQNFYVCNYVKIVCGKFAFTINIYGDIGFINFIVGELHANLLQIQDDVRYIFPDTGNGRKFMQHAINLDRRNCNTIQRGKKNAPQTITQCDSVTSVKRFAYEFSVFAVIAFFCDFNLKLAIIYH